MYFGRPPREYDIGQQLEHPETIDATCYDSLILSASSKSRPHADRDHRAALREIRERGSRTSQSYTVLADAAVQDFSSGGHPGRRGARVKLLLVHDKRVYEHRTRFVRELGVISRTCPARFQELEQLATYRPSTAGQRPDPA